MQIRPVIMCGGAGTRLWPLSRQDQPKQFLALGGRTSLLAQTIERLMAVANAQAPLLVTGEDHRFLARRALEETGFEGCILLEAVGRNTAPAVIAAALAEEDPDVVLAISPSDHFVGDEIGFAEAIMAAAEFAGTSESIGLIGIEPEGPHVGYGYIMPGAPLGKGAFEVKNFHEKPDPARAEALVKGGSLWNAGVFVARARVLIEAFQRQAPDILDSIRQALADVRKDGIFLRPDPAAYKACRSQSIDYAVIEGYEGCFVTAYSGPWSDLGSWDAVGEYLEGDENGNRLIGDVVTLDSRGSLIMSEHRLAVTLGVSNLAVIDTQDAILVAERSHLGRLKDAIAQLKNEARPEVDSSVRVERPWGSYEVLSQGDGYQVKRILVKPGQTLSLQYHRHRSEHWVVIAGEAEVTRDREVFRLAENESTFIPLGAVHRLHNPHHIDLVIIEVQTGAYLGEDDIVRVEDVYGRQQDAGWLQPAASLVGDT